MARLRLVDLQLALVLVDAGKDRGPMRDHGGVVDQVLGAKIVAAIDHEVVAADERESVVCVQPLGVQFDPHGGVDPLDRCRRQFGLRLAGIRQGEYRLTMQIAGLQSVGIDHAQAADPRPGQILQHRAAEASGADHQHPRARQHCLARRPDLLEQNLP